MVKPDFCLHYFDDYSTGYKNKNVVRTVVLEWAQIGEIHIRWSDPDRLLAINIINGDLSENNINGFFFCGKMWIEMSTELEELILTSSEKNGVIYGDPIAIRDASIWVRYVDYNDKTKNIKYHWDM